MASNKCNISIISRQKMGNDKEVNEETHEGSYMDRNGKKFLSYKRSTEDGSVDCLISFDRKTLSMTQKGALNSKLELMPGKKTINKYGTPMGELSIELFTRHYQVIETNSSIKISIEYDIVAGPEPIETSMDITINI